MPIDDMDAIRHAHRGYRAAARPCRATRDGEGNRTVGVRCDRPFAVKAARRSALPPRQRCRARIAGPPPRIRHRRCRAGIGTASDGKNLRCARVCAGSTEQKASDQRSALVLVEEGPAGIAARVDAIGAAANPDLFNCRATRRPAYRCRAGTPRSSPGSTCPAGRTGCRYRERSAQCCRHA